MNGGWDEVTVTQLDKDALFKGETGKWQQSKPQGLSPMLFPSIPLPGGRPKAVWGNAAGRHLWGTVPFLMVQGEGRAQSHLPSHNSPSALPSCHAVSEQVSRGRRVGGVVAGKRAWHAFGIC